MDNLAALRGMNSSTVDLIATDPPFNTGLNREGQGRQGRPVLSAPFFSPTDLP